MMKQNKETGFARLNEIANMFAMIGGKSFDEAFNIIARTKYGREIASNNPVVMYEQTTENLRAIAEELGQSDLFTVERIIDVYLNGEFKNLHTERTNFSPAQDLKGKYREALLRAREIRSLQARKNEFYDQQEKLHSTKVKDRIVKGQRQEGE